MAADVSSGIFCHAGLSSWRLSAALDSRISLISALASSESFFACRLSSVDSSLASVRSARSLNFLVSIAAMRSLVVSRSLSTRATVASKSMRWSFSRMSCAALTMAVTVDGALGM